MAKLEFETFDDFMKRLPLDEQREINTGAEALALEIEVARMKSVDDTKFGDHLRSLGATLLAKLPNGQEIGVPIPGARA